MKWSLADWVPYQVCRCGLGVLALVVALPLLCRWWTLQDATLGVLGGLSSLISSIVFSSLLAHSSVAILAVISGSLTQYLNVASAAIMVRLVGGTELGGVLVCLGSVEQLGLMAGWFTSDYLFTSLLRCGMPGVTFVMAGFVVVVPATIFGVLYFSLGLRQGYFIQRRSPNAPSQVAARHPSSGEERT
ncbi:hypothetical protein GWK47_022173 [Chionoecetes opilio]|uniref:Uncharacterized protein n=1 Tax=Chionoecetes opilio TaxID=41210 RepID=A0A8J4XN53_CHIOP|nr:hypothetical protein GWK47_022173 [Chionoecetes opilio]